MNFNKEKALFLLLIVGCWHARSGNAMRSHFQSVPFAISNYQRPSHEKMSKNIKWSRWTESIKSEDAQSNIKNYGVSPLMFSTKSSDLLKERAERLKTSSLLKSFLNKGVEYLRSFFIKEKTPQEVEIEKNINIISKNKIIYLTPSERDYIKKTILKLNLLKTPTEQKDFLLKIEPLYQKLANIDFGPVETDIKRTYNFKKNTLDGHLDIQKLIEEYGENKSISDEKKEELLKDINSNLERLNTNVNVVIKQLQLDFKRKIKIKEEYNENKAMYEEISSLEDYFKKLYSEYKKNKNKLLTHLQNDLVLKIKNEKLKKNILKYITTPIEKVEALTLNLLPDTADDIITDVLKKTGFSDQQIISFITNIKKEYLKSYGELIRIKMALEELLTKNQDTPTIDTLKHRLKVLLIGFIASQGFEELYKIFNI